jgi:hypothetical protein
VVRVLGFQLFNTWFNSQSTRKFNNTGSTSSHATQSLSFLFLSPFVSVNFLDHFCHDVYLAVLFPHCFDINGEHACPIISSVTHSFLSWSSESNTLRVRHSYCSKSSLLLEYRRSHADHFCFLNSRVLLMCPKGVLDLWHCICGSSLLDWPRGCSAWRSSAPFCPQSKNTREVSCGIR